MSANKKQLRISVTYSTTIENEAGYTEADIARFKAFARSIDDDRIFVAENAIDSAQIPDGEKRIDNEVEWSETTYELVDAHAASDINWDEVTGYVPTFYN